MTTEVPPYTGRQHPGHDYAGQHRYPDDPGADRTSVPYGAITPYGVPLRPHGRLMVRYPERMGYAVHSKRPAVWPILPFTFPFVIPGIVSTARRARRARLDRYSVAPYWVTLAGSFVASWLLWSVIAAVGVAAVRWPWP